MIECNPCSRHNTQLSGHLCNIQEMYSNICKSLSAHWFHSYNVHFTVTLVKYLTIIYICTIQQKSIVTFVSIHFAQCDKHFLHIAIIKKHEKLMISIPIACRLLLSGVAASDEHKWHVTVKGQSENVCLRWAKEGSCYHIQTPQADGARLVRIGGDVFVSAVSGGLF